MATSVLLRVTAGRTFGVSGLALATALPSKAGGAGIVASLFYRQPRAKLADYYRCFIIARLS